LPWSLNLYTEKVTMQETAEAAGNIRLQKCRAIITGEQITVLDNTADAPKKRIKKPEVES